MNDSIQILTDYYKSMYNAEIMAEDELNRWTENGETPVVGYRFSEAQAILRLIKVSDFCNMCSKDKEKVLAGYSPYVAVYGIVYKDENGSMEIRVTNGMASVIGEIFSVWKSMI